MIKQTLAVVPEVEGRPELVVGHVSVGLKTTGKSCDKGMK